MLTGSVPGMVDSETVGHTDPFGPERSRCGHAVVVGGHVDDTFIHGRIE